MELFSNSEKDTLCKEGRALAAKHKWEIPELLYVMMCAAEDANMKKEAVALENFLKLYTGDEEEEEYRYEELAA